ncbi:MAG: hypothetical protein HKN82_04630 [Akkermansiaceae bacterium]|nr:hypothetical protein [Akkermansiaceae bacterium]
MKTTTMPAGWQATRRASRGMSASHLLRSAPGLVTLAWLATSIAAPADVGRPSPLETRNFSDSGVDYQISYTDEAGDSDRVSTTDVDNLEDFAKTSYDRLVNVMNFRAPYLSTIPDYEFIVKDDWWFAEPACVVLDAPSIRAWPVNDSKVVFLHERFHTVQRNYKCDVNDCNSGYIGSTFGKWVSEGTADAIMDKAYADIDDNTGYPYYEGSARNFIDAPNVNLFDREYNACLFWNYLMEQAGSTTSEPHYGVDFMVDFWDQVAANGNSGSASSKLALEQVLGAKGRTLPSIFCNFSVCNYTRDYDVSGLADPDPYAYVDEQTQAILSSVPTIDTGFMPSSGSSSVKEWATRYIEGRVDNTSRCTAIGFRGEVKDGQSPIAWAVVAVDSTGKVVEIRKGSGPEFTAAFFGSAFQPIERVCGIAIGLENGANFDYDLDFGTPVLDILQPTFSAQAYPGPANDPGNIVVSVSVTGVPGLAPSGPGTPSIGGLRPEDFGVEIGGINAPILDSAYSGGLYELLVSAPVQAANGLYDLRVTLCPGEPNPITTLEQLSVLYGNITFHHAVVLDISGSMTFPTSAKLDAAKQSAQFYLDAVNDGDKATVVTFTGDGSECNNDAVNLAGANVMLDATPANRTFLKNQVEAQGSANLTSIGDGLWIAQDALDANFDAAAFDTILLLTDGKENESRYWDKDPDACGQASGRLIGENTTVNTRAFGEEAETDLCQLIAGATGGNYLFVPVLEMGPTPPPDVDPASAFAEMRNQLTLSFLAGLEKAKRLQRIELHRDTLPANNSIQIDLINPYNDVDDAILYVGWSPESKVAVTVRDPNGVDISTYTQVRNESDHHVVFHFLPANPPIKGIYEATLDETDGVNLEVFAGFSGKPGNDLDFHCVLSPVRNGGQFPQREDAREIFELGMPVDISLAARDSRGPIRGLKATLEVIMPDGTPACPKPLIMFDDGVHSDGLDRDGRYGIRYTRTPIGSNNLFANRAEMPTTPPEGDGTYLVNIRISGQDNFGARLERTFEKAFQVYRRIESGNGQGDTDNDQLPDTWEIYYGTNPNVPDAGEDPDNDGLPHKDEFRFGCHPFDPDTDDGGEADGSEVNAGRCPLCPDDDLFPGLSEVALITTSDSHGDVRNLLPFALLLHFPDDPSYSAMEVYRNTLPAGLTLPANRVATIDMTTGVVTDHYDMGLVDGQVYFYRLRALGAGGNTFTPFSRIISAVASGDPAEPFGSILINSGAGRSDRTKVAVKLLPGDDAVEYRLSQSAFNAADPWIPLPPPPQVVPFQLTGLGDGDLAILNVQYRSAGGIESRPVDDTVLLSFTTDNDNDGTIDALDNDDDNDGLSDNDELFIYCTNPYVKDSDGDGYSDAAEAQAGSGGDPLDPDVVPDGDGDEYSDQLEVLLGSDPGDPASTPDIGLEVDELPGNVVRVTFDTVTGVLYRPRLRNNLDLRILDWPNLGGPLEGDGNPVTIDLAIDDQVEFYAVTMALPPCE